MAIQSNYPPNHSPTRPLTDSPTRPPADSPTRQHFDSVIVGGGPVGAIMALGLRQQGRSVALIDQAPPQPIHNALGVDPRTVALSAATRALLETLGGWPDYPVGIIQHIEVWEERGTAILAFDAPAHEPMTDRPHLTNTGVFSPPLGYLVEVGPWREFLWRRLQQAGVDVQMGVVRGLSRSHETGDDPNEHNAAGKKQRPKKKDAARTRTAPSRAATPRWHIETDRTRLETELVVAADGANSIVRRTLDVAMPLVQTGQSALATAARTTLPHNQIAYQRFLGTGPVALLPMRDEHLVSVVWSADDSLADQLAELPPATLAARLAHATQERLGPIKALLPAARFPLRQGVVKQFVPTPGVVFIGDAARVIHPLAGQGINLGFEDVAGVLQCVAGELTWSRYARRRRARSLLAIQLMSALSAAYGGSQPMLQWARNQAVRGLNRSDRLKRALVREAMGLGPLARAS